MTTLFQISTNNSKSQPQICCSFYYFFSTSDLITLPPIFSKACLALIRTAFSDTKKIVLQNLGVSSTISTFFFFSTSMNCLSCFQSKSFQPRPLLLLVPLCSPLPPRLCADDQARRSLQYLSACGSLDSNISKCLLLPGAQALPANCWSRNPLQESPLPVNSPHTPLFLCLCSAVHSIQNAFTLRTCPVPRADLQILILLRFPQSSHEGLYFLVTQISLQLPKHLLSLICEIDRIYDQKIWA